MGKRKPRNESLCTYSRELEYEIRRLSAIYRELQDMEYSFLDLLNRSKKLRSSIEDLPIIASKILKKIRNIDVDAFVEINKREEMGTFSDAASESLNQCLQKTEAAL